MEPTAAQAAFLQTADALYQWVDLTGSTTDPGSQRGALHAALGEPSGPVDTGAISINDFELIRVIGRGSYAKVLMVELKKTKRIYAMKVIKKELVTDDEVTTDLL